MVVKKGPKTVKELSFEVEELTKIVNNLKLKIQELKEEFIAKNVTLNLTDSNQRNQLKCKKCGNKFTDKKEYKLHMITYHPMKIKCNKCQFEGNNVSEIDKHMLLNHGTDNEYKCSKCDNAYISEFRLMKHMKTHQLNMNIKNCHYYNNSKV